MEATSLFMENFERIYDRWRAQESLGAGKILETLGDHVEHVNVLGRRHRDPTPEEPFSGPLRLVEEPENPVDPNAIAVYRGDEKIGYVPRNRTAVVRGYLTDPKAAIVNSPLAIYCFRPEKLF